MDTATMVDMDIMDTTERGKLLLSLVIIMDTLMDTATVTMDTMAREKLRLLLNLDTIIMDMAITEDMDIMDTMAKEKLNLVIIIMVMVMVMAMDIMVKQQLFIDLYSFSYIGLIWPPISQLKHTLDKKKFRICS